MDRVVRASVVVVSRGRPAALTRCLTGLTQQDHPNFEVIVVADPEGIAAVTAQGLAVKQVAFDQANISAARNLGLMQAAGEVVAFIDDDAVAEPTWLSLLCRAFGDHNIVAATGYVRGRNGISFQWMASEVDHLAQDHPLTLQGPHLARAGTARRAIKTQGTNCAFRRATLLAIGGFDAALRFYLDEADVNLRLSGKGLTAVIPNAEVHHGYLPSATRRADRVPLNLHEIAASTAVFLRRHATSADLGPGWALLQAQQTARLAAHVAAGRLDQPAVDALLAGLQEGWTDGLNRALPDLPPLPDAAPAFHQLPGTGPRQGRLIAGRSWQRARLLTRAKAALDQGAVVTVFCLHPSPRAHQMRFDPAGYWIQEGGLFGRSDRSAPWFRLWRFSSRVAAERARLAGQRPLGPGADG